jgi:sulfite reductase (NADPH) flavoprotein alpha-component
LNLERRLKLAEGQPLELRLLAALAQLDCGQCGYSCRGYARALAAGGEPDLSLCFPGGRATARALKSMLVEAAMPSRSAASAPEPVPASALVRNVASAVARSVVRGEARKLAGAEPRPVVVAESQGVAALQPASDRQLNQLRVKAVDKHGPSLGEPDLCEIVLERGGGPLGYRVGDCLAIYPQNDPDVVRQLLRALRVRGQEVLQTPWGQREAWRCLLEDADITHLRDETLELFARSAQSQREAREVARLLEGSAAPNMDLLELLEAFPSARPRMTEIVATLGSVQPRLFSIASSPSVHPNEVRLAVRSKGFERGGRERRGVASSFLTGRVFAGDSVAGYIQHTERFTLPNEDQTPLLMLGFGTGVARFRAFLEELDQRGRRGSTWLLLVNRPEGAEPLYDAELKHWLRKGVLERLDVERAGGSKRSPVNEILRKRGRLVGSWLERGAQLVGCGEAQEPMAAHEEVLVDLISRQRELDAAEAAAYLKGMRRDRRYVCDVY